MGGNRGLHQIFPQNEKVDHYQTISIITKYWEAAPSLDTDSGQYFYNCYVKTYLCIIVCILNSSSYTYTHPHLLIYTHTSTPLVPTHTHTPPHRVHTHPTSLCTHTQTHHLMYVHTHTHIPASSCTHTQPTS